MLSPAVSNQTAVAGGSFNVKDYGATGAGFPKDDTAGINAAIKAATGAGGGLVVVPPGSYYFTGTIGIPANVRVAGVGYSARLVASTKARIEISGSHSGIEHLHCECRGNPGQDYFVKSLISIKNGATDVVCRNLYFKSDGGNFFSTVFLLLACSRVLIQDCTFEGCGYGVNQEVGFDSSHVRVTGCRIVDAYAAFIDTNSATVSTRDWIIDHNTYLGVTPVYRYDVNQVECTFVSLTRTHNVLIAHNHVEHTGGAAAVHLEGSEGHVRIIGNHFENCMVTGGNLGYIYVLHTDKSALIEGNTFYQTDPKLDVNAARAVHIASASPNLLFTGNRVVANALARNFGGVSAGASTGHVEVSNNAFQTLVVGVRCDSAANIRVANNLFDGCAEGVNGDPVAASGGGGTDISVIGNRFVGSAVHNVYTRGNTSGTGLPARWHIAHNEIDKGVDINDGADIFAHGNVLGAGATLNVANGITGGGARQVERDTFIVGGGLKPGT